jgi:DNA-binding XRE family transcriptional regulator
MLHRSMPRNRVRLDQTLGPILRAAREERRESREHVAHKAGITSGTLMRMELGHSDPSWGTVRAVAEVLHLDLCDLGKRVEAAKPG